MNKKVGRNDVCPCGSTKKYKKCCINKDDQIKEQTRQKIIYGDEYISDDLKEAAKVLKEKFNDHEVIDVSTVINNETYKPLQLQHYKKKTIMLVEKTKENEEIFNERMFQDDNVKHMALYRGAYQSFNFSSDNEPLLDNVIEMVETRLSGKYWEI